MVYYFLEWIFISDIVNQYCTIRHSVVNRSQGMKPFLSGCIPYWQVYSPSIEVELFLDKRRLYQPEDMITHRVSSNYYNIITALPVYRLNKIYIIYNHRALTCNVLTCLSLNLSSVYRSTNDVLPTHPSPNRTTLKLCAFVLPPIEDRPSADSSILAML